MKDLRDRCERLRKEVSDNPADVLVIEHFAREIRNEALEEAANVAYEYDWRTHPSRNIRNETAISEEIRALKDTATLANHGKGDTND